MSPDVPFRFIPLIVLVLVVFAALPLIMGGVIGLRRSRTGAMRAISIAAVVIGALLLLVLAAAIAIGVTPPAVVPLLLFLLAALGFVVWLVALADCALNEPSEGNDKIVWVIIILFTHVLGAILYLLVRRPRRVQETGR